MAFKGLIKPGRTYCHVLGWKKFAVREVIEVDTTGRHVYIKWLRGGRRIHTKEGTLLWNMSREDVFRQWIDYEDVTSRKHFYTPRTFGEATQ